MDISETKGQIENWPRRKKQHLFERALQHTNGYVPIKPKVPFLCDYFVLEKLNLTQVNAFN